MRDAEGRGSQWDEEGERGESEEDGPFALWPTCATAIRGGRS